MTDSTLVFPAEREGRTELVVNFGVFAGRTATDAEIHRLAQALLAETDSVEIVAEQRFEFDREVEATVHQVRVRLGGDAAAAPGATDLVEAWAQDCIGERRLTP